MRRQLRGGLPDGNRAAPYAHASSRLRRLSARERQRRETVEGLLRAGLPRRQADRVAREMLPSPAAAILHACLPAPVVVRHAARRLRESGFGERPAAAVAHLVHRHEHFGTMAHLAHAGNLSEPLAAAVADEVHPAGMAAIAAALLPAPLRRCLCARRLHRAGWSGALARAIAGHLHPRVSAAALEPVLRLAPVPIGLAIAGGLWLLAAGAGR